MQVVERHASRSLDELLIDKIDDSRPYTWTCSNDQNDRWWPEIVVETATVGASGALEALVDAKP